jgi:hypothetical protein
MRIALLLCVLLSGCVDPVSGKHWLQCSMITSAGVGDIGHYTETFVADFDSKRLYLYNSGTGELANLESVSFFPQMIDQNFEYSANGRSIDHEVRINLRTMEIIDRYDTIGTGYNSGHSSHDTLAGTCRWTYPLL